MSDKFKLLYNDLRVNMTNTVSGRSMEISPNLFLYLVGEMHLEAVISDSELEANKLCVERALIDLRAGRGVQYKGLNFSLLDGLTCPECGAIFAKDAGVLNTKGDGFICQDCELSKVLSSFKPRNVAACN